MDIARLDLNLLCVFNAIFEEGSATAAAKRLHVSQPTVSSSLAKLRHGFDDPLFVRTRVGMTPTPFAMQLREPVLEALTIIERRVLPESDFVPLESERTWRISTSDVGELCFMPKLLEAIRERAPNTNLKTVLLPPEELEKALETAEVDLAVGYFPDLDPFTINKQELFEHPFVVIARKGHPLAKAPLALSMFLSADHAVVEANGRSQEQVELMLTHLGLKRRVVMATPYFMSLPPLIMQSDLIATVPRSLGAYFARHCDLALIDPPLQIPAIALAQHWHIHRGRNSYHKWLRDLVSELFLDRDPTIETAEIVAPQEPGHLSAQPV